MEISKKLSIIKGSVKHYDWGGKTFIPVLLNMDNREGKPFAEYWLGDQLGERFEKLPFLFKVQDVEKMLSIQVHPSREVAVKKFKEENEKGIPLDAPNRNYKDENHKPELLSPLGDFYLLHGFRQKEEINRILTGVPELASLKDFFSDGNLQTLYSTIMTMPQEAVNEILSPLIGRIVPLYQSGKLARDDADFWAARAALTFTRDNNIDRGIFSIYLFNVVRMSRGQALFQDAGLPHAYLEGQTMEIMANSDNVLRGGLTPKHIDVPELLAHIRFESTRPDIIPSLMEENKSAEQVYKTSAEDFQLSRIQVKKGEGLAIPAKKTDLYFVYSGKVRAVSDEEQLELNAGTAMLAIPGAVVHFAAWEDAIIYRSTEPVF